MIFYRLVLQTTRWYYQLPPISEPIANERAERWAGGHPIPHINFNSFELAQFLTEWADSFTDDFSLPKAQFYGVPRWSFRQLCSWASLISHPISLTNTRPVAFVEKQEPSHSNIPSKHTGGTWPAYQLLVKNVFENKWSVPALIWISNSHETYKNQVNWLKNDWAKKNGPGKKESSKH